jgi:hypothetical protein
MLGLLSRLTLMSKIVRYEFMGSWALFWLLCVTGIGIPFAVLILLNGTLRIEDEMADPEQFVSAFREGKRSWGSRKT